MSDAPTSDAERRSAVDGPRPLIRAAEAALHATDLESRWLAETLALLAGALGSGRALAWRLAATAADAPEVLVLDRAALEPAAVELVREAAERFGAAHPFAPVDDWGLDGAIHGWPPPAADPTLRRGLAELCRRAAVVDVVTLSLRDAGRLAVLVAVVRTGDEPRFSPADLRAARELHRPLATAYPAVRAHAAAIRAERVRLAAFDLSPAEREVARLLARGATNLEIARALSRSPATVSSHAVRIFAKLGVSNRTQLAWMLAGDG